MVNKSRTINFLPEIFQTSSNKEFLNSTLDVITSQPELKRIQGFIGEKYGYGIEPKDRYIVEPTKSRRDYQLDPAVIFLKPETQTAKDFINYPGMITSLKNENAIVNNHDRLFNSDFYSWDSFVDLDKIVNYSQYFWLPTGPLAVPISTRTTYSTGEYIVTQDDNGYQFQNVPGTNPSISLLRGGTYTFVVPANNPSFKNFWIQTVPGVGATSGERTIAGVTNNGTNDGTITFVVPASITLVNNVLYYQSGDDPLSVGLIQLIDTNDDDYIDIDSILDKQNYTSPNGVPFTNGLKVVFDDTTVPSSYENNEYYVEGVGTAIKLLPVSNFVCPESSGDAIFYLWDEESWDTTLWDAQVNVSLNPEYITINRNSRDYNAWTRANRWFHQDVINITQQFTGQITSATNDITSITRAKRPIIEYYGNLKLFNSGVTSLGAVDIIDTVTTDAFSALEGQLLGTTTTTIDKVQLQEGTRIIFTADTNPGVRQNVYIVSSVQLTSPGSNVVALNPDPSVTVINDSQVFSISGEKYVGSTWRFDTATLSWIQAQQKTELNQYPLYDVFDSNNHSLSDNNYYLGSSFAGIKLFSYAVGTGVDDAVLGFPIAYSNISTIGDILFDVNFNSATFTYSNDNIATTQQVNTGFVHDYVTPTTFELRTGWVPAVEQSFQYQVFEFPIIENTDYSLSNTTVTIINGGSGYNIGDKLYIPGTAIDGLTPDNDLLFTVESVNATQLTAILDSSIIGRFAGVNGVYNNLDIVSITGSGSSAQASIKISGFGTVSYTCDVPASTTTAWKNNIVYLNDTILNSNQYQYSIDTVAGTTTITLDTTIGTKVTILLISDSVSKTAYYQTPFNLENNPFNENVVQVNVGDIRNQYQAIFTNAPGVSGPVYGDNNIHDLGNLNKYGNAIIQTSASLVLPGVFLRNQEANLWNALQFNSEQYLIYKTLLVDLAISTDYSIYQTDYEILNDIISKIASIKNSTTAFFWSDMIPSGNPYRANSYSFAVSTTSATLTLNQVYNTTSANYYGVLVYITDSTGTVQLIKDVDYTISNTSATLSVNYNISANSVITVNEYNQTYGSYCPNTPSKMGLYPSFIPGVVLNDTYTTPTYFILGHDGSYNKLYGDYNETTGQLSDFRDRVLLEFEKRVYNNIKVSGSIPLQGDDVIPGQFRTTEYSRDEILQIYSIAFLNWVGANRVDYKTQKYISSNKFSYNYNQSTNTLTNQALEQGYWRGIYNWLYDTDNPASAPWEMLGLVNKPTWWDSRYGVAPYTSGNTYMWSEIAAGYVWNDGDPYIDEKRIRPQLLSVLPVDGLGQLLPPFNVIVGSYNSLSFDRSWKVGDGAPAESSYLKSSTWPFDLMRLLALIKPAKFFNLFVDRDLYKYNTTLHQYLYNDRYHLDPRTVQVYGDGTSKNSYINWIVDYINQKGEDGTTYVTTLLQNLDVRLVYNLAGFSAKNYLKFLVEKATPNSKNTSLLIPDESYEVLLYNDPAQERINYSAVIVQKVENGWMITGHSKNKQYFTTVTPRPGYYKEISAGSVTVKVSKEFYNDRSIIVPYGTVFYSTQAVSEFLQNYGRYLSTQGIVFDNIIRGELYDWSRIIQEFLYWSQQGWEIGSLISVNPNAKTFVVNRPGLVVEPLTLQDQNFILNQNLLPVQSQDACITREQEKFTVEMLNDGDTVAYANLNLNSIEHAIVFDNTTVFNDVIYNLVTGLRQPRLLLQGYKSGLWNGYLDASGFIISQDNIKEWQSNLKYPKNKIVSYKDNYYSANKLIEPSAEFSKEDWSVIDKNQIKLGLLPNPSTTAYESLYYYDCNRANLENDVDLLAFSLIGFRPRDYLAAADLSDITQINVYKNIIKTKGTELLANAFKNVTFDQGSIDYTIQENWAIKTGDFGSVLNQNFVECALEQGLLTSNPTTIGFSTGDIQLDNVQQTVQLSEIINYERPPTTPYFLPENNSNYTVERGIPSAGYVNLNDSKFKVFNYEDLNLNSTNISTLYRNDNVWIANYKNSWGIFTAASVNTQVVQVTNNLNNTITVLFAEFHNLVNDDLLAIINFDPVINGFYKVKSVQSQTAVVLSGSITTSVNKVQGLGQAFKLVSRRFEQPSEAASTVLPYSMWDTRLIWADYNTNNQWSVYGASPVYKETSTFTNTATGFGSSVGYSTQIGYVVADGNGNIYRYKNGAITQTLGSAGVGAATQIRVADEYVYCSSPSDNRVYIFNLDPVTDNLTPFQTIAPVSAGYISNVTGAIAVSDDKLWLYVADSTSQKIVIYYFNGSGYLQINIITSDSPASSSWGASIATSVDGTKLVVGAPNEDIGPLTDAGAAYVYSRRVQSYQGDGSTVVYTISSESASPINETSPLTPPTPVYVYVNDVIQTYLVNYTTTGSTVQFTTAPAAGAVISISSEYINFLQRIQSDSPHIGALFGNSVDTNRYGAEIIIGSPYEISTVDNIPGVEGAVYRYTNSGQRYGITTSTFTGIQSGIIFVDGYRVVYSGTISQIVNQINSQTPTNIIASYSGNTLVITVTKDTPDTLYNILDITGNNTALSNIGIQLYTKTQVLYNFNKDDVAAFGYTVKMNERDSLIVSAITNTQREYTTFDYKPNCVQDDTIFDNDSTIFVDSAPYHGVVYEYDYLPAANESIDNPGKYAFGQYISTVNIQSNVPQPHFGINLSYNDNTIVVGTPRWIADNSGTITAGGIAGYTTDWTPTDTCEVQSPTTWYLDKSPLNIVDINAINNISIYNIENNETLDYLDYIDPLQGKLFGAISTNLDFINIVDPAVYSTEGVYWILDHVGQTWLDLTTVRLLNYHQPDVAYNSKNWGVVFPGSTAGVYTWIESTVTPLNYSGSGVPVYYDKYNSATTLDRATNSLVTKYYFWVKNYDQIPAGKTLSPITLSEYILNPLTSGISYLAPITTNIVALYNCGDSIQANNTALHIGYGLIGGLDEKHTNWNLIRENDPEDFLPGLPTVLGKDPGNLYLKFIESFSGYDVYDNIVPDPTLPALVKYGTSFRPRQSMFIDRNLALNNYLTYANNLLIQYPITEIRNLTFLEKQLVPTYNTNLYWEYVNWWAEGYSNSTKAQFEVNNVSSLLTFTASELLVGPGGLELLQDGLIVKVIKETTSGRDISEYYIYNSGEWTRIGLVNGTIQFKSSLWLESYGWSSAGWGLVWDKTPAKEIYWIVRWLNEQCYIDEFQIYRNLSLILMFNFIQSESQEQANYLPWLNKTSLVDVNHRIRNLLPYKKYQRDNQEFLEGYLNEIKPYHVYIKNFVFSYTGFDDYLGIPSDFDLPAKYNPSTGKFETPQIIYQPTYGDNQYLPNNDIWQEPDYNQWFNNYGLSISNREVAVYPITYVTTAISEFATSVTLNNVNGLPASGSIIIGEEEITYNSINYNTSTLVGLNRGAIATTPVAHGAGSVVSVLLPPIEIMNKGRDYTSPPIITAYIDTTIYPAPRVEAKLAPIMAAGELIGIDIINPGSGYVVKPQIIIENSSITDTFAAADVDISNDAITMIGHPFVTGDCVYYETGTSTVAPDGLIPDSYYYVRKIDDDTISLYYTVLDASYIISTTTSITVSGTTTGVNQLTCNSTSNLVEDQPITFSGTTFGNVVANTVYFVKSIVDGTTFTISSTIGGSTFALTTAAGTMTVGILNPLVRTTSLPSGAETQGVDFKTIGSGSNNTLSVRARVVGFDNSQPIREIKTTLKFDRVTYQTSIPEWISGTAYAIDDMVLYSDLLYRCAVANSDVTFTSGNWTRVYSSDPELTAADRVYAFYSPTINMPGNDPGQLMTGVEYENAVFLSPPFPWNISSITRSSDVVTVNTISTTSLATGDYVVVDGTSSFDGTFGPITVVSGTQFTYADAGSNTTETSGTVMQDFMETPDTLLQSPPFVITTAPVYDVADNDFLDGYGPEELVAGYITDSLVMTITSDDISPSWTHTISVDNFGDMSVISDSLATLDTTYLNKWWYGTIGLNPLTDPTANTTLSVNINPAAVFLRT